MAPGIDEALERLVTDPTFRDELARDPKGALAGYDLTRDELSLLAQQLSAGTLGQCAVERRLRRSRHVNP